MADLTKILNGPWSPQQKVVAPPEEQLRTAIAEAGLIPPDQILLDGKIHRFRTAEKKDKSGWYVAFSDSVPAGRYGCWREGIEMSWRAYSDRDLTPAEEMRHAQRIADARILLDAEIARQREVARNAVDHIWDHAPPAPDDHPYLQRKQIKPHNARVTGDNRLILPLYDAAGNLSTLQYISADGAKMYHAGGAASGCYNMIGDTDATSAIIYIAEGYATAATIHQVTGSPCAIAYSASNLPAVCAAIRSRYGSAQDVVIVADSDVNHTGETYAREAASSSGASVVLMPVPGDANDYVLAGRDLSALLLTHTDRKWLINAADMIADPAPIKWLIKRWVQDDALIMMHGPSGCGKTFVALDWCLHLSTGLAEWHNHRVNPCATVYLAGEGYVGLRGRVAAWMQHHGAAAADMWVSRDGCDLNTADGYAKIVDGIRSQSVAPGLIVVDTLHRFLRGDENSAQDAKSMLDACNWLIRDIGCSVMLIHHTGVADDAQHRARGSSAWRGALDIEISVVAGGDNVPIQLVQRKSKDAELAAPTHIDLQQIEISGWIDDDGDQITSAVAVQASAPTKDKTDSHNIYCRSLIAAWEDGDRMIHDGSPYVLRSALRDKLIGDGRSERTVANDLNPSYDRKMIGSLTLASIVKPHDHGWIVIDPALATIMLTQSAGHQA